MANVASIGSEQMVACDDDHASAGQRLAYGFKCLASDDDVMPHRQFTKAFQVGRQSPRQTVFNANASPVVYGSNYRNDHIHS
jgi:hypothetical protein